MNIHTVDYVAKSITGKPAHWLITYHDGTSKEFDPDSEELKPIFSWLKAQQHEKMKKFWNA